VAVLGIDVGKVHCRCPRRRGPPENGIGPDAKPAQEESVLEADRALRADAVERLTHGTTIATNALLERRGARTVFVGTAGFEHLLHLRRKDRAHLFRLCEHNPEPLVPLTAASAYAYCSLNEALDL
jgi:N-methylhydantoinase A/oxoprolinase/acetone carboxylase beta subunit